MNQATTHFLIHRDEWVGTGWSRCASPSKPIETSVLKHLGWFGAAESNSSPKPVNIKIDTHLYSYALGRCWDWRGYTECQSRQSMNYMNYIKIYSSYPHLFSLRRAPRWSWSSQANLQMRIVCHRTRSRIYRLSSARILTRGLCWGGIKCWVSEELDY